MLSSRSSRVGMCAFCGTGSCLRHRLAAALTALVRGHRRCLLCSRTVQQGGSSSQRWPLRGNSEMQTKSGALNELEASPRRTTRRCLPSECVFTVALLSVLKLAASAPRLPLVTPRGPRALAPHRDRLPWSRQDPSPRSCGQIYLELSPVAKDKITSAKVLLPFRLTGGCVDTQH